MRDPREVLAEKNALLKKLVKEIPALELTLPMLLDPEELKEWQADASRS